MNSKRQTKIREISLKEVLAEITTRINRVDLYRSCLTCTVWQSKEEMCGKWKQRPPAEVIANGCDDYFDQDDTPF